MRVRLTLTTAFLLVVAACTGSTADTSTTTTTTTSSAPGATTPTTLSAPEIPRFPDDDEPLPTDDGVLLGTLDNGITYYIRENARPGGRAQLRLAVQAGSIQESPDQRGAAHYLEHMMFNGTERYPANELVKVLQRFGAEFGADINAYTSYEETVYQLELPTDEAATIEAGFDVLFEWATAVALAPDEVELEKGVLVEEWRLRDQGFWGRYFAGVSDRLLANTEYEGHQPLGTPAEVEATTPETLRAFYDAWYRTDTMAVIAVGDFDAASVEELIVERFAGIPAAEDPAPVPKPVTEPAAEPTFLVLADPETVQAWSELNYPLPAGTDAGTVGALRRDMAFDLAWAMIVTRLDEASLRGDAPFWNASFAANPLVRGQRSPGLAAYAEPEDLAETTEILLGAVEQARIHGFTAAELERAITEMRGDVQLAFDERATTQDRQYAERYAEHFLGGGSLSSAEDLYEVRLRILDEMSADQVWNTFAATVNTTEPLVILVAPEADGRSLPDESGLADIVDRVHASAYEPWVDEAETLEALMGRPAPADIVSREPFSDTTGLPVLTFANGARVVYWATPIRDDVVVFAGASVGGWAPLDPSDVAEAQMVSDIVVESGVGDIDQVTLERSLAGLVVSLTPYIDETEEGFFGEAGTKDLETLFQLIHLYMTAPRFEEVALGNAVSETLPYATDPGQLPDLAVAAAVAEERFGDDTRFAVVPPPDDLLSLDLERAGDVFRDAFDDPGDFVFVFAGDLDPDVVEELAAAYIGTIPESGDTDTWVDVRPDPPDGIVRRTVEAGTGELGGLTLLFSTDYPLDHESRLQIDLLELIVQQRLTDRIREELSASYSPFTVVELVEAADESVDFWVRVSADPEHLDEISAETLGVIDGLRATGPTADELAIASEQLLRDYQLYSNEQLTRAVIFSALRPEERLIETLFREYYFFEDETLTTPRQPATRTELRDLARALFPEDRYIEIRLIPASD